MSSLDARTVCNTRYAHGILVAQGDAERAKADAVHGMAVASTYPPRLPMLFFKVLTATYEEPGLSFALPYQRDDNNQLDSSRGPPGHPH